MLILKMELYSYREAGEADVKLRLVDRNGPSPAPLLLLHSSVLRERSDFFASLLSRQERIELIAEVLEEEDVIRIAVPASRSSDTYLRCLHLMYVQRETMLSSAQAAGQLGSVQQALCMLEVAADLLFRDCVDMCQAYLEMRLTWTAEEQSAVRASLSSLQLSTVNPHLAARLCLPHAANIIPNMPARAGGRRPMVQLLRDALLAILRRACSNIKTDPLASNSRLLNIAPGQPVPEAAILHAWSVNLNVIKAHAQGGPTLPGDSPRTVMIDPEDMSAKVTSADALASFSTLKWLLSRLLDLGLADIVIKAFANDTRLSAVTRSALRFREEAYSQYYQSNYLYNYMPVVSLLQLVLRTVQNGEALLPQPARKSLLRTWLPAFQGRKVTPPRDLGDAFCAIIQSLPLIDQGEFFNDWCSGRAPWPDLTSFFGRWCAMIMDARFQQYVPKEEQLGLGKLCTEEIPKESL